MILSIFVYFFLDIKTIVVTPDTLETVLLTIQGNISCLVTSSDDDEAWNRFVIQGCPGYLKVPQLYLFYKGMLL